MNNEENTLTIETYISWKNKRFALKDFIKEALKELEDKNNKINKAIEDIDANIDGFSSINEYGENNMFIEALNEIKKGLEGEENGNN